MLFKQVPLWKKSWIGNQKEDYILTLINSMDMPTYMIMLLVIFGMDVYGLIKYRKVKAPWKVAVYLQPVTLIAMAINRVIKEYAPYTHLHNVSVAVTLTIGGIWFVIICITGFINKKRS